ANTQQDLLFVEQAIESYGAALKLNPNLAEGHYGLAIALKDLGRREQSIAALTHTLRLDPSHDLARAQRLYQLAHLCDWPAMSEDLAGLPSLGMNRPVSPFALLSIDDDPKRQSDRAARYAETHFARLIADAGFAAPAQRIRLGYFSADFRNHAM